MKVKFRRLLRRNDPRLHVRVSPEAKQALAHATERNARTIAEEAYVRLAVSLEREDMMLSDRLSRLIFCPKLAYKGK